MKNTLSSVFVWLAAVLLAFALAFASPNEASVMGRLPDMMARTLLQKPVSIPDGMPSDRTLALITFQRGQRSRVEAWINGLNLKNDTSISWMRMPVINDPGNAVARNDHEVRILQHYPMDAERANVVPVFTDSAKFVRSAGLGNTDQVYAVVVNRRGDVLARVEGDYDTTKAAALRETLLAHGL